MGEHMTTAEVVKAMRKIARKAWVTVRSGNEIELASALNEVATTLPGMADAVEQHLTPRVLAEPDGPGDYWVEGRDGVHRIAWSGKNAAWACFTSTGWELLGDARVCHVPKSPFAK